MCGLVEIYIISTMYVISIVIVTVRISFSFPEKANKVKFWIITPCTLAIFGIMVFIIVRACNL